MAFGRRVVHAPRSADGLSCTLGDHSTACRVTAADATDDVPAVVRRRGRRPGAAGTSAVVERQALRVHLGVLHGLVRQVVLREPLAVRAVLDELVDGLGDRLREPAALLGRRRDEPLQRGPGAGVRPRGLRLVGTPGALLVRVGDGRVRAEVAVDLARVERELHRVAVRVVLDVDAPAVLLELGLPLEQDLLLVRAGAHGDCLARQHRGVAVERERAVVGHLQRELVLPVRGEVVLLLALLGHGDVREPRVELAAVDADEQVVPRGVLHVRLEPELRGDETAEVGFGAGQGLLVVAGEGERREPGRQGADADGELARGPDVGGQGVVQLRVLRDGDLRRGRGAVRRGADGERAVGRGGVGVRVRGAPGEGDDDAGGEDEGSGAVTPACGGGRGHGAPVGRGRCEDGTGRGGRDGQWTRDRKSRVRGCCGASMTWAGGPCSTTRPWSRNTTWSATSLAKATSCVTMTSVVPDSARSRITPSTSPTSSGSSADVGSSSSTTDGSRASARAIATRCCCPPESCRGRVAPRSPSPTRSSSSRALAFAGAAGTPAATGPSATFSSAVRCGKSSKCWNTNPMRDRCRRRARSGSAFQRGSPFRPVRSRTPIGSPPTVTTPRSRGSRWLIVRRSVDLPDPDGPRTTVTLPAGRARSTPSMTTWSPNALTAPWMPMAALMRRSCRRSMREEWPGRAERGGGSPPARAATASAAACARTRGPSTARRGTARPTPRWSVPGTRSSRRRAAG
ncbi:putative ABC transporter substrate-binding protein [Curtobacterium sp. ER1/6]|nr:putative ABC transporter substrate-binding protein [Curtobacterium sp. ER1/6]